MTARKPIIGLAGGIGSGKSTVAAMLAELGAAVICSDQLSHQELNSPEVLATLMGWWGRDILRSDGSANRAAIRTRVQAEPEARRRLEGLLHPRIAVARHRLTEAAAADPNVRAVVWDSPLLFETGLDRECDAIVFVEAGREQRLARVTRERGWTPEELERFEQAQKPLDFKREHADYIVSNNSDKDAVRQEVAGVFSRILSGAMR